MNQTYVVCSKCGKIEDFYKAKAAGWLIAQRINKPAGYLVIRCKEHITSYALRQAGQLDKHASGTAPDTSLFLGDERKKWLASQGGIQPTIRRLIDQAMQEYPPYPDPQ